MNREIISEALGLLDGKHIAEAETYHPRWTLPGLIGIAAAFSLICIAVWFSLPPDVTVVAYAQDSEIEITSTGAILYTGTIDDSGTQTGHPLMFYLSGEGIERVRFSCQNQLICFTDWTEKRDEFGMAQNFTVSYGPDSSEYYYLLIDWMPERTIRELHKPGSSIAALPPELREDKIVMEITFSNGRSVVKAVSVSLLDDGNFFAAFGDYRISKEDEFIFRPDAPAVPGEFLYGNPLVDRENGLTADEALDILENCLVSNGYVGENFTNDDGEPYFWDLPMNESVVEGKAAYVTDLLFGPNQMVGRLYGSFAVSKDGKTCWHYDQANDCWDELVK